MSSLSGYLALCPGAETSHSQSIPVSWTLPHCLTTSRPICHTAPLFLVLAAWYHSSTVLRDITVPTTLTSPVKGHFRGTSHQILDFISGSINLPLILSKFLYFVRYRLRSMVGKLIGTPLCNSLLSVVTNKGYVAFEKRVTRYPQRNIKIENWIHLYFKKGRENVPAFCNRAERIKNFVDKPSSLKIHRLVSRPCTDPYFVSQSDSRQFYSPETVSLTGQLQWHTDRCLNVSGRDSSWPPHASSQSQLFELVSLPMSQLRAEQSPTVLQSKGPERQDRPKELCKQSCRKLIWISACPTCSTLKIDHNERTDPAVLQSVGPEWAGLI